jgi:hypothetical protein
MNENQIWKIKKIIGVKLKNIYNVIAYSKIKKNSNQNDWDQLWRKNKL